MKNIGRIGLVIHGLRHTHASLLLFAGVSISTYHTGARKQRY